MTPQFESYVRILLALCKQGNDNFSQLAHDFDLRQEPTTCLDQLLFNLLAEGGTHGIEVILT